MVQKSLTTNSHMSYGSSQLKRSPTFSLTAKSMTLLEMKSSGTIKSLESRKTLHSSMFGLDQNLKIEQDSLTVMSSKLVGYGQEVNLLLPISVILAYSSNTKIWTLMKTRSQSGWDTSTSAATPIDGVMIPTTKDGQLTRLSSMLGSVAAPLNMDVRSHGFLDTQSLQFTIEMLDFSRVLHQPKIITYLPMISENFCSNRSDSPIIHSFLYTFFH